MTHGFRSDDLRGKAPYAILFQCGVVIFSPTPTAFHRYLWLCGALACLYCPSSEKTKNWGVLWMFMFRFATVELEVLLPPSSLLKICTQPLQFKNNHSGGTADQGNAYPSLWHTLVIQVDWSSSIILSFLAAAKPTLPTF